MGYTMNRLNLLTNCDLIFDGQLEVRLRKAVSSTIDSITTPS